MGPDIVGIKIYSLCEMHIFRGARTNISNDRLGVKTVMFIIGETLCIFLSKHQARYLPNDFRLSLKIH